MQNKNKTCIGGDEFFCGNFFPHYIYNTRCNNDCFIVFMIVIRGIYYYNLFRVNMYEVIILLEVLFGDLG